VLVQVRGDAGARHVALVHADVEARGAGDGPYEAHGLLGQRGDLHGLIVGRLGVLRDVAVGADHQVPRRVGVEVQHRVRQLAASYDQAFLVRKLRDATERALLRGPVDGLVRATDVGHPVRRPQTVELVGAADPVLAHGLLAHGRES
jgi:hypothetical protein